MFRSVNSVAVAVVVLAASFGCSTTGTTPTGGTAASGTNVGFDVDFAGKDGGATDSAAGVKDENTPDDIQEKSDIVPDVPTDVSVAKPKACDDPDNKPKCDKQHGHCEPGTGGKDATCKCDDGLDGDPYSEGGCSKNVNECDPAKPPVCGAGTVCSNLDPIKDGKKYECPCNTKASFDIPVSATECDCDATKHKKKNAASTQCICDESSGFVPDASGNCISSDVCKGVTCGPNMLCSVGADGKPVCGCVSEFFTKQGDACVDKKECNTDNGGCGSATFYKCMEVVGGPPKCSDINECAADIAACDLNSDCSNTVGGYACVCKNGYKQNGKTCIDVDECGDGTSACDLSATCSNTDGSYKCTCKPGYTGTGKLCVDLDECKADNGGCGDLGAFKCTNVEGGLPVCTDINECNAGTAKCSKSATCKNTVGSYDCKCKAGFQGDGQTCDDIDECKAAVNPCGSNAICTNKVGAPPDCGCGDGFSGTPPNCTDVDECAAGIAACDTSNSKCVNLDGAEKYKCECNPGYQKNGSLCVDINECTAGISGCDVQHATCKNETGAPPICKCKVGWGGNGKKCVALKYVITLAGADIALLKKGGTCWDSGCKGLTQEQQDNINIALAKALELYLKLKLKIDNSEINTFIEEYLVKAIDLGGMISSLVQALAKPDPFGIAEVGSGVETLGTKSLKTVADTFNPSWPSPVIQWGPTSLNSTTFLKVALTDNDYYVGSDDPIGQVTVSDIDLLIAAEKGGSFPIPTSSQDSGRVLAINVVVSPTAACGNGIDCSGPVCNNGKCEAGETASNCPWDCKVIACGNAICEIGETLSACPTDCKASPAGCKPDAVSEAQLACKSTDAWNNSDTGSTKVVDSYTCPGGQMSGETGSEYVYTFTADCTGNATITVVKKVKSTPATPTYLDLFVLDGSKPCSGSSCLASGLMNEVDTATVSFSAIKGAKYFIAVDGYNGFAGDYSLTTTCSACP